MSLKRPSRKPRNKAPGISSVHFVGYVEDQESVASIMKKFEELEKIQQEGTAEGETTPPLSEEQLQEVFRRTSSFTVEAALRDEEENAGLGFGRSDGHEEYYGKVEEEEEEDEQEVWREEGEGEGERDDDHGGGGGGGEDDDDDDAEGDRERRRFESRVNKAEKVMKAATAAAEGAEEAPVVKRKRGRPPLDPSLRKQKPKKIKLQTPPKTDSSPETNPSESAMTPPTQDSPQKPRLSTKEVQTLIKNLKAPKVPKIPKAPKVPKTPKTPKDPGAKKQQTTTINRYKIMKFQSKDRQGNLFTIERRVRHIDPSVPTYVKIPHPIGRSWAHTIAPLIEQTTVPPGYKVVETTDILSHDLTALGSEFQAIYMDPPLLLPGEAPVPGKFEISKLAALPIPILLRCGFIFVWVEKELIYEMLQIAEQWGFKCVENYCWIRMTPNNRCYLQESPIFNKTKLTMLVFRRIKEKDSEIALRHQRNADAGFDFIQPKTEGEVTEKKPSYIYDVIETLLPSATPTPQNPNISRLLELWARRDAPKRAGWTTVIQL